MNNDKVVLLSAWIVLVVSFQNCSNIGSLSANGITSASSTAPQDSAPNDAGEDENSDGPSLPNTPIGANGPNFGTQSSNKALEWGFDFVEEFDGLADWNQSSLGRVGNQWDVSEPGYSRMPVLEGRNTKSPWGYFSLWGDGAITNHSWIGGTENGTREVWRGRKSLSIDLGNSAKGPSRLGLSLGRGYHNWSYFYMIYMPKNNLPTHIACSQFNTDGSCRTNNGGLGTFDPSAENYTYWAAYKFNTFSIGCLTSQCREADGTISSYGLQTHLTNLKHYNFTTENNGLDGVRFSSIKGTGDNVTIAATDGGTILDDMFGSWFGLEVNVQNISANQYQINMWTYDRNGNSVQIMIDKVFTIVEPQAFGKTWDHFFFGGNNSGSWEWGPTMTSHYYIDDFIIDAGEKGRIGPRYFEKIK